MARCATIVGDQRVRDALNEPGVSIYEGAQGVLLDEGAGFHPHTTWSRTTLANADAKAENTLDSPMMVIPVESAAKIAGADFVFGFAPNSLTILRIPVQQSIAPAR